MNRKLKALGLALVATSAFAAVSASGASAVFTSEVAHTTIVGSQVGKHVFTFTAGTASCNEATYSGTSTEASTTHISVKPTYSECTIFGFVNAKIDTEGCEYEFTSVATNAVHIKCGPNPIRFTAFNCEVTVPSQTVNGGITYDNEGAGKTMDVKVTVNLTGITYIQHNINFPFCSGGAAGTNAVATSLFHNGTVKGETTFTASNTAGEHVSFTVS